MKPLSYRHWIFSGQRQPIMRRASRLHSWDVFACDLLPNRLRLLDRSAEGLHEHTLKTIQKTQWNILGDDETSHALHFCLPCSSQQRSTSANHLRASRLVLGTFSHASPFANRLHPCGVCLLDGLCESSPRRISTGRLHALRRFHSPPINLIVFEAPYRTAP